MYKASLFLMFFVIFNYFSFAQNKLRGKVVDELSSEPIAGVNILLIGTIKGTSTDLEGGFLLTDIPNGKHKIRFTHIGYREKVLEFSFPSKDDFIEVILEEDSEEIEEIFVDATRLSRTISNEPTRVEVVAEEEIGEKISMEPSNISMLLNESTGIQVQQTSAASVNNTFRIQGLDGRYTQLLKDGFPLYSGFSGSLSIVQIPPLDLKQIEIIKGSLSTLYGGGAIAGLINLITKSPSSKEEISFLLNGTSVAGVDISGFYSKKSEKIGITFLASHNSQKAYDNNNDNFSDLPKISRYSLNPKLFLYFDKNNTLTVGANLIAEYRIGGSISTIKGQVDSAYTFTEKNLSNRFSTQVEYKLKLNNNFFTLKNSLGYFNRRLILPSYEFVGRQISSYSEAALTLNHKNSQWIIGLNLFTENFNDLSNISWDRDSYDQTVGVFVQGSLNFSEMYSLETGLRADYNNDYNLFVLPRASLLVKWSNDITIRLGGGLGYKIPTIFTETSEARAFRDILRINKNTKAERSFGVNLDFNYRTILFNNVTFSVNNLFFYTRINEPLYLASDQLTGKFVYNSLPGFNDTKGVETNIKLTLSDYKLFIGYTYTDVKTYINNVSNEFPLTPKNRLGLVLIYEKHNNIKVGLEAYYTGKQKLSNGNSVTDYWVNGFMIEKKFGKISLFLNFENFLDTRQSKYGQMYNGSPANPEFVEIYAPTDGRIINGGIKITL